MEKFVQILTGVFILILVFLFLSRGRETVAIIQALFDTAIEGVAVLQGRE